MEATGYFAFGFFLCNSEDCKPSNVGNCFFRSAWAQLICRSVNCQQQTPIFSESEQTHGLALCYQELARTQSEPSLICQEQDKCSWELQKLDQQEVQVPSTPTFTILCPSPSTWKRTTLNTQSGQALEEQTMERSLLPNQSCCTEPMEELRLSGTLDCSKSSSPTPCQPALRLRSPSSPCGKSPSTSTAQDGEQPQPPSEMLKPSDTPLSKSELTKEARHWAMTV